MSNILAFEFDVNKENKTIRVTREFAASLSDVWDAWTKPELLDLWWAPKPFKTVTKSMDFREGGAWLYSMVGPDGTVHWSKADYLKIVRHKNFSGLDAFCDESGKVNPDFPRSQWNNIFTENSLTTTVQITVQYDELSDLEKIILMGFKEGFTMALGNLDQYFELHTKL